jgi:DNA invertase Pin-like site-specific DNA recombinase
MDQRVIIYTRSHTGPAGTDPELVSHLRRAAEARGDIIAATLVDDAQIAGRGKYAGWRKLLARLDEVDEVIVGGAGDLPGRTLSDLLKILGTFRDHLVGLRLHHEQIDTASTGFATLEIVEKFRAAKLSQSIKAGQAKALTVGKRIGRPPIPPGVLSRIRASLAEGFGIRPTARKYRVSPASVATVKSTMATNSNAEATSP